MRVVAMVEGVKALGHGDLHDARHADGRRGRAAAATPGLDYYNHNIDTSERYYGEIITTRTFADRLETLAQRARRPASRSAAAASSAWARRRRTASTCW